MRRVVSTVSDYEYDSSRDKRNIVINIRYSGVLYDVMLDEQ